MNKPIKFPVNNATIDLIKHAESLHDGDLSKIGLQPKRCPAGIWTYGYGHALFDNSGQLLSRQSDKEEAYRQAARLEESGAVVLLAQDLEKYASSVKGLLKVSVLENKLGAMVSLAYNIGINAFKTSTVLKRVNQRDFDSAANAFLLWNKGRDRNEKLIVMAGLTNRRNAEKALFLQN
jgi:lysozyme